MREAVTPTLDERPAAASPPAARRVGPPSRRRRARDRLRAAVPVLLVVLAAGLWFSYYERQVTSWIVMTDELLYAKLGVAVGSSLSPVPRIHGEYYAAFSQLYPILTAPFYRFLDMPTAFEAVHLFNAFLMASTAIPVYLLAREVVRRRRTALLAAALSVCVPWVTMGLMLLTESAAYPAFAWALLAMHRSIVRPGPRADLLALAGIGVAFLARTQFIVLAVALPLVIVGHELAYALAQRPGGARDALRAAGRRLFRGHIVLVALYGAGALALVPIVLTGAAARLLGNYAVTTQGGLLPPGVWRFTAVHLDFLIVGLAVIPFVAGLAWWLLTLVRPADRAAHALAVLSLVLIPALALQVGSFSLRFAAGVQDRYLFYVAPLILVSFVACLADRRRTRPDLLVAGVAAAVLLSLAEYAAAGGPFFGSPASAFHQVLDGRSDQLGSLVGIPDLSPRTVVLLAAIGGGVAMAAGLRWLGSGRTLAVAGVAALAFMVLETHYVFGQQLTNNGRTVTEGTTEGRDWIDQEVGDANVALMPSQVNTAPDAYFVEALWWDTEFWNKSANRTYAYDGANTFTPFPVSDLSLDFDSGATSGAGDADYLVLSSTNVRLWPVSTVVATSEGDHLTLLRTPEPLRAEWATRDVGDDGWTGRAPTIRLYGTGSRQARRVAVTLTSTPEVPERRRYTLAAGSERRSGTLDTGESGRDRIDVCVPASGHVDVDVRVDGTTTLPDGREVGLRLTSIRSTPSPSGPC